MWRNVFLCEKKNNCNEIAKDKYWAKQSAKQEIQNLSEHSLYSCAKKGGNTSKLFSICKYLLWIFSEDEYTGTHELQESKCPKCLIKRTNWNRTKEGGEIFIYSITKYSHHHHPRSSMGWVIYMRSLGWGRSPLKAHTPFIHTYEWQMAWRSWQ